MYSNIRKKYIYVLEDFENKIAARVDIHITRKNKPSLHPIQHHKQKNKQKNIKKEKKIFYYYNIDNNKTLALSKNQLLIFIVI